jgi:hypothetical protein
MDTLPITDMLERLNQALTERDWQTAEILGKEIRSKAKSQNLFLSESEKSLIACAIAFRDVI